MRKRLLRAATLYLIPPFAALLIWLLYRLNKKEYYLDGDIKGRAAIFAVWHGDLLMLGQLYRRYRKRVHGKVLISDHFDGRLISRTISYFGFETIVGSTSKRAVGALIEAIRALREGYDVGITPDGPRGPRHQVGSGIVKMAQKTGAPIVLVSIVPSSYWEFASWDRFKIPKPFGTLRFYTQCVDVRGLSLEEAKRLIKEGLERHAR